MRFPKSDKQESHTTQTLFFSNLAIHHQRNEYLCQHATTLEPAMKTRTNDLGKYDYLIRSKICCVKFEISSPPLKSSPVRLLRFILPLLISLLILDFISWLFDSSSCSIVQSAMCSKVELPEFKNSEMKLEIPSSSTVVLDVRVGRGQQLDQHRDGTGLDQLFAIFQRMGHVQQGAGGISLHSKIWRLCKFGEWDKGAGCGDFGFVFVLCGQVGDASHCVALDFDVGAHHLSNKGHQPTHLDYKHFVFVVDSHVSQRGTGCALNVLVGALQQNQNWLQDVS
ncbi:hypothetical protein OGAPHI_002982 [Ogataea philodendri]|uniref:Uncharacterized protein n=1 Tax=Ogataea philodendri TaxID=1378263 RepID=A0A9P8P859_9ASCO|nr:uncharacterized protein OGAPHI_002982 [Ogataea philodendri]KAH3667333.1 hypothetical protein OGAPHI_002982 [Ogataea philodendri]